MATLGELKARIAREMDRDDLTADIADAIPRAIEFYAASRFKFNENTATITTTANVDTVALPSGLRFEDNSGVFITVGGFKYQLEKVDRTRLQYWQSTQNLVGQPVEYAIETGQMRLFPTPNQAYEILLLGVYDVSLPATDNNSNAWTTTAEDLIAARARYQLARDVTYDTEMAGSALTAAREAFDRLMRETSRQLTENRTAANW